MSIWNKILLGCIAVAALLLFVLGSRALQAHRVWRESYNKHIEAIAAEQQKAKDIVEGNSEAGQLGLRRSQLELYKLLIGRGRVWDNIIPMDVRKEPDPESSTPQDRVQITLQTEQPDAIEAKTVVYAFQCQPPAEGQESGKVPPERGIYLGQFTVDRVGGNQVIVHPSVRLSDSEFARVQASQQAQVPWRLYELMPSDDHDLLRALTQEEKEFLFPNKTTFGNTKEDEKYSTVDDYLYDGQIITKEQAEAKSLNGRVVMVDEAGVPVLNEEGLYTDVKDGKGMFIRTLRDYGVYFNEGHRLRSMIIDRIRAAQRDLKFLNESLEDSRMQRQTCQNEIRDLEQELAKAKHQRDTVLQHEAKLDQAIASMKNAIADLIARNEAAVAQIAQIQAQAAQVIAARTAGVVQTSTRQPTGP